MTKAFGRSLLIGKPFSLLAVAALTASAIHASTGIVCRARSSVSIAIGRTSKVRYGNGLVEGRIAPAKVSCTKRKDPAGGIR
jgi:hypothetical protein